MARAIYSLGSLMMIASLGIISEVQCIRFCSFCDTTSPVVCKRSNGKCLRPAKCDSSAMQRCERNDDLCLSSWRYTAQGLSIHSGCFPLPPHSKRSDYSKNCKPWQRNGTYTCLCRRNGCNKYPSRQSVSFSRYQATTTKMMSNRGTISVLASVEGKNVGSHGRGTSWMNMVTRWILIACSTVSLVLIFTLLIYCIRAKNNIHNSKDEPDGMIHGKGFLNESEEKSDALKPVTKSVISQGKNSTVWHGFFNGKAVALKYFSRNEESLWQNECSIYSKCTPGHENILTFIAASDPRDNLNQIWLATSFYDQGSLQDFLTAHTLTWDKLLTMAKCITAGLSFLHSERQPDGKPKAAIAHQDLKSKNILVGNDGNCVLADFGLSMDLSQGYLSQVHRNGQVGTYRYMAPEKLEARIDVENPESFKQIDVYSLALVLWELLSRCDMTEEPENTDNICTNFTLPFEDVVGCSPTLEQMTKAVVVNGRRPSLPNGLSSHQLKDEVAYLWTTIKECWDKDPEARLTAACVNTRLMSLVIELK